MKVNLYDFDGTIYSGDSSIDFYLYCFRLKKSIIFSFPKMLDYFIKYKLKKISKERFKEQFFSFLQYFDDIDVLVEKFWQKNIKKIKKWYIEKDKESDIIISASPEFLLQVIADKLMVKDLIATKVDKKIGKFLSKNCYGEEKVIRFMKKYANYKVKESYSDSFSDIPIFKLAEKAYLVKKNKIRLLKEIEYIYEKR